MGKPKISVIIPFYGVEKYIEKCLRSVLSQTFLDFEVILIDDGSLDNSYLVAYNLVGEDNRFKIIRQKNKGLGGARNTGLSYAVADYVVFLDSDDWWDKFFLEKMYDSITKNTADIVFCGFQSFDENGKYVNCSRLASSVGVFSDKDVVRDLLITHHLAWDKIYRRELFDGVQFPERRYYEDFSTIYKLHKNVKKVVVMDDKLYNYLRRNSGITGSITIKHINDLYLSYREIIDSGFLELSNLHLKYYFCILICNSKNRDFIALFSYIDKLFMDKDLSLKRELNKKVKILMFFYNLLPKIFFYFLLKIMLFLRKNLYRF